MPGSTILISSASSAERPAKCAAPAGSWRGTTTWADGTGSAADGGETGEPGTGLDSGFPAPGHPPWGCPGAALARGISQFGTWRDPELLVEAAAYLVIGAQRGGLVPGARQRDHQPGVGPLVERLPGDQLPQVAEHAVMPARRRGCFRVPGHCLGPQ